MTVQFAKHNILASEFDNWQLYFERRFQTHEKEDYLAALIASAIYNANGTKTKLDSQLLKFSEKTTTSPELSQSIWLGALGIPLE
jgi:hypothetical protein